MYELRVVSSYEWMIGGHGTSHSIQHRGYKCDRFYLSILMAHPLDVMWSVWMEPPCLVACLMVYQSHQCLHR